MSSLRNNHDSIAYPRGGHMNSYINKDQFPEIGAEDTIYRDKSDNRIYLWNGEDYISMSETSDEVNGINEVLTSLANTQLLAGLAGGRIYVNEIKVG